MSLHAARRQPALQPCVALGGAVVTGDRMIADALALAARPTPRCWPSWRTPWSRCATRSTTRPRSPSPPTGRSTTSYRSPQAGHRPALRGRVRGAGALLEPRAGGAARGARTLRDRVQRALIGPTSSISTPMPNTLSVSVTSARPACAVRVGSSTPTTTRRGSAIAVWWASAWVECSGVGEGAGSSAGLWGGRLSHTRVSRRGRRPRRASARGTPAPDQLLSRADDEPASAKGRSDGGRGSAATLRRRRGWPPSCGYPRPQRSGGRDRGSAAQPRDFYRHPSASTSDRRADRRVTVEGEEECEFGSSTSAASTTSMPRPLAVLRPAVPSASPQPGGRWPACCRRSCSRCGTAAGRPGWSRQRCWPWAADLDQIANASGRGWSVVGPGRRTDSVDEQLRTERSARLDELDGAAPSFIRSLERSSNPSSSRRRWPLAS
jgi:hypothetical protein